MAFVATKAELQLLGNKKFQAGSFTNGGSDTGGSFVVPFNNVECINVTLNATSATIPYASASAGTVTITTAAGNDGYFLVIGW